MSRRVERGTGLAATYVVALAFAVCSASPVLAQSISLPSQSATPSQATAPANGATTTPAAPGAPAPAAPSSELKATYDAAFQDTLQNPSDPKTLAHFAEVAVQYGDIEGAISALERLLLIDGDEPEVKLELGVLYYRLGSTEAARTYLEAARNSNEASEETKERAAEFLKAAAMKR
ncbi:MAG TPA: tetratricopeptide repeat protein [Reyranella sp.]|nr:tetratricopeptide repeat protein [Reyranella sp.]